MSVRAVQWALEVKVGDATAKLVLLALADEADTDGLCWPFHARLAARAEVSEKTVSRKIAFLEAAGLLKKSDRKRRRSGRLSGYNYTLALPPQDTMSGGGRPAVEDAAQAADAAPPTPHGQDDPPAAPRASDESSPAPSAPEPSPAPSGLAGEDQPPADNVSPGPPDTAVSYGPPDTQVSGGKDLDPPRTDPPPPTPSTGGGGSAAAAAPSPALTAIADRLDAVHRRRLLTEPAPWRRDLDQVLDLLVAFGWPITAIADHVTAGSLERVASVAGVLRTRAERLAGVEPPQARRSDADGIPPDVAAAIDQRARDDSFAGGAHGALDVDLERQLVARYRDEWLAEHQEREVTTR